VLRLLFAHFIEQLGSVGIVAAQAVRKIAVDAPSSSSREIASARISRSESSLNFFAIRQLQLVIADFRFSTAKVKRPARVSS
jgi:hypothetical protein